MNRKKRERLFIMACLSPAVILFLIFMVWPTFEVFRMSLYRWGGFSNTQTFVGLENFKILWNDSNFYRSFQNTILLIVVVTVVTLAVAIFFANILIRRKVKRKEFFQSYFLYPKYLVNSCYCRYFFSHL